MQNRGYFRAAAAIAACGTLLAWSAPANAFQPYGGGLTAQTEQWPSRTYNTVYNSANVIKSSIDNAWSGQTDSICNAVKQYATQPGVIRSDITVKKVTCNFAPHGSLWIDPSQLGHNSVGLRYLVPGNSIVIITSKPAPDAGTVVGGILTGGVSTAVEYAPDDPEFSIKFDIAADVDASIQHMSLNITSAVASVRNVSFDARNFLASLALAFQPKIRNQVETAVGAQKVHLESQVSNSLGLINAAFAPLKDQGYTQVQASLASGRLLLRFVGKTYQVATTGPGRITGAVYFTPTAGQPNPANICHAMSIRAETANSFNDVSQFNVTNMAQVGHVGPITGGPAPGQRYACSYEVTSVPVDVPITILVRAQSIGSAYAAPSPVGWNGTVTLPGFAAETKFRAPALTSYAVNRQPVKASRLSPATTTAHPVTAANRTALHTVPAPALALIPSPSVGGNTASNMNFTMVWEVLH